MGPAEVKLKEYTIANCEVNDPIDIQHTRLIISHHFSFAVIWLSRRSESYLNKYLDSLAVY